MRMRTKLLLALFAVSFGLSAISLIVIRSSLERQVRLNLHSDLLRSVRAFENLQSQRRQMLQREAALLADLPSLKALMTTSHPQTIRDGGIEFWRVSGMDLFALADREGAVIAVYEQGRPTPQPNSFWLLERILSGPPAPHLVLMEGRLYEVSFAPLYFGSASDETKIGDVIIGYAIDDRVAREVSETAAAEVIFAANGSIVSSTLDASHRDAAIQAGLLRNALPEAGDVWLGHEHYLVASLPLGNDRDGGARLFVLKSYDEATRFLDRLNRIVIAIGICVLLAGALLATYLARTITRPLEGLAAAAGALGAGDFHYEHKEEGAREVRELARAFQTMRDRLRETRKELLEAERLATIGRMSSSISHDLRHSLSAVYANAEFLESSGLDAGERAELLGEVRQAVQGMTELIDSLLLFSRTGQSLQLGSESLAALVERAIVLVKKHPDAQLVRVTLVSPVSAEVNIDGRKVERAIYNLLLNACQAAVHSNQLPEVRVSMTESARSVSISIEDNGPGVPESIRSKVFEPFVSEGKHNGIGLGLALALRIAQEHGGTVVLSESQPGKTLFQLMLAKESFTVPVTEREEVASTLRQLK